MLLAVFAGLAAATVAAALAVPSPAAGKPTVAITGTTVKDGVVTVAVRITGWKLLPALVGKSPNKSGGGHWHVFVDGKYDAAAAAAQGVTHKLAPGAHTISAELANNDHSRLRPPVRSAAVRVTVTAPSAGAGAPPPAVAPSPAPADKGRDGGGAYGY